MMYDIVYISFFKYFMRIPYIQYSYILFSYFLRNLRIYLKKSESEVVIVHLAILTKNFVRYYLLINSIYNKFINFMLLLEFKTSSFVILLTLVVNIYYKKGRKKENAL